MSRGRREIEDELLGFLRQSRISSKNQARLNELVAHEDPVIRKIADLLIRVSRIAEGKKRRWKRVKEADYSLYLQCEEAGLTPMEFCPELFVLEGDSGKIILF